MFFRAGVDDALNKKVLKTLIFSIAACSDTPVPDVLEQYEFSFSYADSGAVAMTTKATGQGATASASVVAAGATLATPAVLKRQAAGVIRALITGVSTLDSVPNARALSMHLIYNDSVEPEYEPPGFVAANADALGSFSRQPLRLPFGGVRSEHHKCALSVRSVLDAAVLGNGEGGDAFVASQCNHSMANRNGHHGSWPQIAGVLGGGANNPNPASQSDARVGKPSIDTAAQRAHGMAECCDSDSEATRDEDGIGRGAARPIDADTAAMPPPPPPPPGGGVAAAHRRQPMVDVCAGMAQLSVPHATKKRGAANGAPAPLTDDGDGDVVFTQGAGWHKRLRSDAKVSQPLDAIVQRRPHVVSGGTNDVFSAAFL
jgi:HORMA domain